MLVSTEGTRTPVMRAIPKHLPALDGLRGVAILLVILSHVGAGWHAALSLTQNTVDGPPTFAVPNWVRVATEHGGLGVYLFFIVSAFTLASRTPRHWRDVGPYALRRIARIGPAYWLAGIGYTMLAGFGARLWAPDGLRWSDCLVAALFGSAWQGGAALAVVPGGWSISCEVSFYVALPIIIWLTRLSVLPLIALTAVSVTLVQLHTFNLMQSGQWTFQTSVMPLTLAPVFLAGLAAAAVSARWALPRAPGLMALLLCLAAAGFAAWRPRAEIVTHGLLFTALAAPSVCFWAQHPPRLLASGVLSSVGRVSYSMYLIHFAVLAPSLWLCERLFPQDWRCLLADFLLCVAVTYVLSRFSFRWIEQPFIDWAARRRSYRPRPA